jgi:hypothetical protein
MRRRVIGVLILLLLGVTTSVLVAWGCVYWGAWFNMKGGGWGYYDQAGMSWSFSMETGFGLERVQLAQGHKFPQAIAIQGTETPLPKWVVPEPSSNPKTPWSMHVAAGWPLVSMACQTRLMDAQDEIAYRRDDAWQNAIRIRDEDPMIVARPLPLRPIWWNAVFNTLIFAAAWWLLLIMLKLARAGHRHLVQSSGPTLERPICPRCGYDQRGAIVQWTDQCPIRGRCSECGLEFEWFEILNPQIRLPHWCVECRVASWRFPLQMTGSILRTKWPWLMWRRIRMSHELSPGRLAAYLVTSLAMLYLVFALSHGWAVWHSWNTQVNAVSMPATPTTAGWPVFAQAAVFPWSSRSIGTFTTTGGWRGANTYPYTAPLWHFRGRWKWLVLPLMHLILIHPCCGVAFIALPISRRKAKVRWRHIVRIVIYGTALAILLAILQVIATALQATQTIGHRWVWRASELAPWLFVGHLIVWWCLAASRYLRMEHGWGVGIAAVIIGLMLPLVPWAIYSMLTSPL